MQGDDLRKGLEIGACSEPVSVFLKEEIFTIRSAGKHRCKHPFKSLQHFNGQLTQRHPSRPFSAVSLSLAKNPDAAVAPIEIAATAASGFLARLRLTAENGRDRKSTRLNSSHT